jgi:flagellar protein FlaJ
MSEQSQVNQQEVEKIVETMKKKYREEGLQFDEVTGTLKELRGIIAEDTYSKVDIESKEDAESFDTKIAQDMGKIYIKLKTILKPLQEAFKKIPFVEELGYYLYSANMHYSANQFLAITSAVVFITTLILFIAGLFVGAIVATTTKSIIFLALFPIMFAILGLIISTAIMLYIPKQKAIQRGNDCSVELPFALRHMATELKAGIGLYKTLQAVTASDYGVLSEEFARTITEIEEGTDTSVALKHMALRTQSKALKTAISHIIRAMRIGGNLSTIMNEIADDVSEDLKNRITTFSQKMNFFAVVFIFVCIVLPVAIMILGAIRNSPIAAAGQDLFKAVPLDQGTMIIFFLLVMPVILIGMNYFIYTTQPKM